MDEEVKKVEQFLSEYEYSHAQQFYDRNSWMLLDITNQMIMKNSLKIGYQYLKTAVEQL